MENTTINQTATISYSAPRPVNIGDVFYYIEREDFQAFHDPCIVCEGTSKLTVKGVTFDCPCCRTQREVFKICKYVVRRYRVSSISQRMPEDDWKASDTRMVTFELYHKSGRGIYDCCRKGNKISPQDLQYFLNIPIDDVLTSVITRYIYDDYKLAVSIADALTQREIEALDEYNTAHGTDYTPVFRAEHDKKSK